MKIPSEHLHFPLKNRIEPLSSQIIPNLPGFVNFQGLKSAYFLCFFSLLRKKSAADIFQCPQRFYYVPMLSFFVLKKDSQWNFNLTFECPALLVKFKLILPFMVVKDLCRNVEADSRTLFPASALTAADKRLPQSL